jgi:hypothetical protein
MKNKYKSNIYSTYNDYDDNYKDYGKYINMNDYIKEYYNYNWNESKLETEEEKLAREKAERRNSKIDQILG